MAQLNEIRIEGLDEKTGQARILEIAEHST